MLNAYAIGLMDRRVRRGMRGPPVGLAKCAWSNRRMWLMSDPEALAFVAIVALMLAVAVVVALT